MLDIVDSHLHLWDLSAFAPPWLAEAPALYRSFTLADWQQSAGRPRERRLAQAVYVEIDAAPADRPRENRLILGLARDPACPIAGAVIAADLLCIDVEADLAPWLDQPGLKGVRHVLHMPQVARGTCLEPAFVANMRRLGALNLAFDACLRPNELMDLARLAEAAPDTVIVLDHCGNPGERLLAAGPDTPDLAPWRAGFDAVAACPNVVCKISGLMLPTTIERAAWAGLDFCLDRFGPERVLWASNFPVSEIGTPTQRWLDFVLDATADRATDFQTKLFATNAARVYRLET